LRVRHVIPPSQLFDLVSVANLTVTTRSIIIIIKAIYVAQDR